MTYTAHGVEACVVCGVQDDNGARIHWKFANGYAHETPVCASHLAPQLAQVAAGQADGSILPGSAVYFFMGPWGDITPLG